MDTTFEPAEVAAYENETWSRCAPDYDRGFAVLTGEAVGSLLDAAGVAQGSRVLDLGTGTGTTAAAARDRGATVVGVDFSDAMLAEARRTVTDVTFQSASVEALPLDDGGFDAVVANGVLHHLARPVESLAEAHRVLSPGGRVACTVWSDMDRLEAFGLYFAAVAEHAGEAELPHGPLFGVTDHDVLRGLFTDDGFTDVQITELDTRWRMSSIDDLLRAFGTWAQIDAFPAEVRSAVEASVRAKAASYDIGGGLIIPNPMLLVAAGKPTS